MYTTRALADYVSAFHAEGSKPETREAASRCVLDVLAAAIAGFHVSGVAATRRVAGDLYRDGPAAIWFSGQRVTPAGATFCNSAAASILDLDDGNREARGHPGAAVIPAALAISQEVDATAERLLDAIVVGYEVGVRVAMARGFHARTGLWCGYGAVAAAGFLRRTPPRELSHAFAIAGITAPNLLSTNGGPRYPVPVGNDIKEGIPWATVTGMTALHLAESGLLGPEDILDDAPHYDRNRITDGLGSAPEIFKTYFKPYACCRHIHAPVDAFEALIARHSLTVADIVAVDVFIYGGALLLSNRRKPANLVDVQYSIPYCIGLTAILGSSALLPIDESVLDRTDASEFAEKVNLHLDRELDQRFPAETLVRVVVKTATSRFESPVTAPRGEASAPLSRDELRHKFLAATRKAMTAEEQYETLDAIEQLRKGDLSTLNRILSRPLAGFAA